jgi:hypothetical protein
MRSQHDGECPALRQANPPIDSASQSSCAFITPVMEPCRSGEHQTWTSDQIERF